MGNKKYWELTEADGLTPEQVSFNRHLHRVKVAKDAGKKIGVVHKEHGLIPIK